MAVRLKRTVTAFSVFLQTSKGCILGVHFKAVFFLWGLLSVAEACDVSTVSEYFASGAWGGPHPTQCPSRGCLGVGCVWFFRALTTPQVIFWLLALGKWPRPSAFFSFDSSGLRLPHDAPTLSLSAQAHEMDGFFPSSCLPWGVQIEDDRQG